MDTTEKSIRAHVHFKCTRSAIKYTRGVSSRVRVHKAFWPVKMKAKRTYVHYGKIDTSSRTLGFHCKNEGKRLRAQWEPSNLTILELFWRPACLAAPSGCADTVFRVDFFRIEKSRFQPDLISSKSGNQDSSQTWVKIRRPCRACKVFMWFCPKTYSP